MKMVPGYVFKIIKKPMFDFKLGESYRIYHISPINDGVEYIFQSSSGNLKTKFSSTAEAEAIIEKMLGK